MVTFLFSSQLFFIPPPTVSFALPLTILKVLLAVRELEKKLSAQFMSSSQVLFATVSLRSPSLSSSLMKPRSIFSFPTVLSLLVLLSCLCFSATAQSCKDGNECSGSDIRYEACVNDRCGKCSQDSDCDRSSGDVCNDGFCGISGLFDPFDGWAALCTFTILLGAMIAAGGGLGGGGIFIPTYVLILSLGAGSAAALSQATIFGGSIVNLIMNFKENSFSSDEKQKHSTQQIDNQIKKSKKQDHQPMLLGGTIIGVIFNVILPQPITLACLVITV